MALAATVAAPVPAGEDQRVYLRGLSWKDFEVFLALRGDQSAPRVTFLDGVLELMSPSREHEGLRSLIGRLVEAWAEEKGLEVDAYGSWTLKSAARERGLEPDECYVLAGPHPPEGPDLAIEVVWTSGGLDKLAVYEALGVGEVWVWQAGALEVWLLGEDGYVRGLRSALFPDLDLDRLVTCLEEPNQTRAVRAFREWIRTGE